MPASSCPRTGTTTGRRRRRDELARLHDELADALARLPAGASVSAALPAEASSFVGREHELGELRSLLARTRLLTLYGARRRRQVAARARAGPRRGERVRGRRGARRARRDLDPRRVPGAVAAALDLRALPEQALLDALLDFLAPRRLLLVLDNCEHVLAASAALAGALLRGATQLTIVATSREPIRVPGEVVFRVPSLAIPDPERTPAPDALLRFEAVRLFVERAASAAPGFALDDGNAVDVARICFRLDGLPLALELAAGRLGALGPADLAGRLDDRFRLLRGGGGAAPTRQQTLEATLQWSHDLLEPGERALLRRLAIFAGGFDLAAVEEVCAGGELEPADVAHTLARLVEKSLVAADDAGGGRRYRLLETVRLYASERLAEAGEAGALAERHAGWALALAERERGSTRLDPEAANLRAAHDGLLARAPGDALRLAVALWPFWLRRIDLAEARDRLAASVAGAPEPTALRAEALLAAAAIDFRAARSRAAPRGRGRASPTPPSSATRARSGVRCRRSASSSGSRPTRRTTPSTGSSGASSSRAGTASVQARRSACTPSASRAGRSATSPARTSSSVAASRCSARSPARRSG